MDFFSETEKRKTANAKKLAGFGVPNVATYGRSAKVIREGSSVTIYTVGYERRDGEDLIAVLRDQGVQAVADIRERPTSRRPDFRAASLRAMCESAGIEYQPWHTLGSTVEQRENLQQSGDFVSFASRFREHALQTMTQELSRLAEGVKRKPTALLCYERLHEDCHRSVISELVADELNATVVAIQ